MSDEEISASGNYFFKKAALEVKERVKKEIKIRIFHFRKMVFCTTKEGYYQQKTVMNDLSSNTFGVPGIYRHSPLACSIVNEIHWHSDPAKHSSVETVWRYVLKFGYIMVGRELVKKVRKNCERCRYLTKKAINTEILQFQFTI